MRRRQHMVFYPNNQEERHGAAGDPEPYGVVDIVADHPDYNRVTVRQVQVFDGILTTQEIFLVPSPGIGVDAFPDTVYDTPDQGL